MPPLLRTGDLGYCSADGLWHIIGRLKRQIKLSGVRWQLDSLERQCRDLGWELVACGQDQALRIACRAAEEVASVSDYLHLQLGLHPSLFRVAALQELPHDGTSGLVEADHQHLFLFQRIHVQRIFKLASATTAQTTHRM